MCDIIMLPFQGEEVGMLHYTLGVTLLGCFQWLDYVRFSACKTNSLKKHFTFNTWIAIIYYIISCNAQLVNIYYIAFSSV